MKILAIDTSTSHSSLAVVEDQKILGSFSINQVRSHSETLVPMLKDLLNYLHLKICEIDGIVIGQGPGSFTGLRIGMTIGKTLAQVEKKPIIGLSTLKALAAGVESKNLIVPLLDARGGRVYYGGYLWEDGKLRKRFSDDLIYIENLKEVLPKGEIVFTGEVTKEYFEELSQIGEVSHFNAEENLAPNLGLLGEVTFLEGGSSEYKTLIPKYIRPSQAERDFKKGK